MYDGRLNLAAQLDINAASRHPLTVGEATADRATLGLCNSATPSGGLLLAYFTARKTEPITQVRAYTGGTAAVATPTLCRYGVFSEDTAGNLTLLASTVSDTTLWSATYTAYTRSLTSAWAKTAGQRYAVGIIGVSGSGLAVFLSPMTQTAGLFSSIMGIAPRVFGIVTGLSDLPSSVATGSIIGTVKSAYCEVLP